MYSIFVCFVFMFIFGMSWYFGYGGIVFLHHKKQQKTICIFVFLYCCVFVIFGNILVFVIPNNTKKQNIQIYIQKYTRKYNKHTKIQAYTINIVVFA